MESFGFRERARGAHISARVSLRSDLRMPYPRCGERKGDELGQKIPDPYPSPSGENIRYELSFAPGRWTRSRVTPDPSLGSPVGTFTFSCQVSSGRRGNDKIVMTHMYHWTQESATAELKALTEDIGSLTQGIRFSAAHMRWIARTLALLEEVFGRKSRYYLTFAHFALHKSGNFQVFDPEDSEEAWDPQQAIEQRHHHAYLCPLDSAKGF